MTDSDFTIAPARLTKGADALGSSSGPESGCESRAPEGAKKGAPRRGSLWMAELRRAATTADDLDKALHLTDEEREGAEDEEV